jgi:hypothetical protein
MEITRPGTFDLLILEFVCGFTVWVHMHWAGRRLELHVVASDTPAVCTETPIWQPSAVFDI